MRVFRLTTVLVLLFGTGSATAQVDRFEFADRPRLVDCRDQPCFRLILNSLDVLGQPASVGLTEDQALERFQVREGERRHPVFHLRFLEGRSGSVGRGNYSMVLFDISGSMNRRMETGETQFEAAKLALLRYLEDFEEGMDHVAVVPFESRQVVSRIRAAAFETTAEGVGRQIDSMPRPQSRNNTALYSAIYEALPILKFYRDAGYQVSLVVLTDGENDVRPPPIDDPGLLGNDDRHLVVRRAEEIGIQIIMIGFGLRTEIDEEAMRDLAWPSEANYYFAGDAAHLGEIFRAARSRLTDRIEMTLGPVRRDKSELTGQTVALRVALEKQDGRTVRSEGEAVWVSPAIGAPPFEAVLTHDEMTSYLRRAALTGAASSPLTSRIFWRFGILSLFGAGLLLCWLGIPRLIWPERYIAAPPPMTVPQGIRAPARPSAPVAAVPRAPNFRDPKVTIAPRGPGQAPRPALPKEEAPKSSRRASDETVYIPPGDKN